MTLPQDTAPVLPRHPAHAANTDFIYMTLPLIAMATYLYGARTLALCLLAVLTANLCDRLVAVMRRRSYDKTENSSIAAALIVTLLLPASISYYVLIATVTITVVLGKAVFGGWGAYPFTPAALGFAAAALSWPDKVLYYPEPFAPLTLLGTEGVALQQSAAHTLAAGGLPNISVFNLLLGNYAGGMGTTAALVTVACAAYLWMRKRITLAAPLGFLGACAAIAYFFPRLGGVGLAWPWQFVRFRLLIVTYEILSGALLYAAVFLLNDDTTLPKRQDARLLYGIVAGVGAMVFRYYGSFDMGVCFALLWTNVLSGPLDRWMSALAQSRASGAGRVRAAHKVNAEKPTQTAKTTQAQKSAPAQPRTQKQSGVRAQEATALPRKASPPAQAEKHTVQQPARPPNRAAPQSAASKKKSAASTQGSAFAQMPDTTQRKEAPAPTASPVSKGSKPIRWPNAIEQTTLESSSTADAKPNEKEVRP